jgi:glycosyltransferase involved in cell wall biosynthesis
VKLLMVSHYFESHRGGVEIVAGRLARELQKRGAYVTWAASDVSAPPQDLASIALQVWNGAERRLGVPYPLPSPAAVGRLVRAVREADIVLAHDALYATSLAAVAAAKAHRRPVLMVQHIGQVPYRSALMRGIMGIANRIVGRPMLGAADQVVFISGVTAQYFAGVGFRSPPTTIFNGVDTSVFRTVGDEDRRASRQELGLAQGRTQALFVGRFVEKKGLGYLEALARQRPEIDWNFAGWGPIDPQGWGLPNVRVFRDLSGGALARLYQASDVFVLPSVGEGFPLVIQEALACGLPVVCGEEVLGADPQAASLLCGVALSDDLAGAAARLSAAMDQALHSRQGREDREAFARSHYSWDVAGARYLELCEALP